MPIHRFVLLHYPCEHPPPRADDPRYDALRAHPPAGCVPAEVGGLFGLRCQHTAPRLLDAVAAVCAEVAAAHGILLTDLGVEKPWEWSADGLSGFGATLAAQLLLMATHRAHQLGYTTTDLVVFLTTVAPPPNHR